MLDLINYMSNTIVFQALFLNQSWSEYVLFCQYETALKSQNDNLINNYSCDVNWKYLFTSDSSQHMLDTRPFNGQKVSILAQKYLYVSKEVSILTFCKERVFSIIIF